MDLSKLLYGLAQVGLGVGQGYYGGIAERNRLQYGINRQQWDTQHMLDRERQAQSNFESTAFAPEWMTEALRTQGIPVQPGQRAPMNLATSLYDPDFGKTYGSEGIVADPNHPLFKTPLKYGNAAQGAYGFGRQVATDVDPDLIKKGETERLLGLIADAENQSKTYDQILPGIVQKGHPLFGVPVRLGQMAQGADEFSYRVNSRPDAATAKAAADAQNAFIPKRIGFDERALDYTEQTRLPVSTVKMQNDALEQQALANTTPIGTRYGENVPDFIQQMTPTQLGVAGGVMNNAFNMARANYQLTPWGTMYPDGTPPTGVKPNTPVGLLPDIAATGQANQQATQANRTGDTPETWFSRTINTLNGLYANQREFPAAMKEKFKKAVEQAISEGRFQWTNEEKNRAFQMLDAAKPLQRFQLQGQTFEMAPDDPRFIQYLQWKEGVDRDEAAARARSAGNSGGIPETMEKFAIETPQGVKYLTYDQYRKHLGLDEQAEKPSTQRQAYYAYGSGSLNKTGVGFGSVKLGTKVQIKDQNASSGYRTFEPTMQTWLDNHYFSKADSQKYPGQGALMLELTQQAALEIANARARGDIKEDHQMNTQFQARVKQLMKAAADNGWRR
ncbi:MAG: hypothetical protein ACYDCO_01725 [Armatimonadota bacterium]